MFKRFAIPAGIACLALPAAAKTTGGLEAECHIMGQQVVLQLQYERFESTGVTYNTDGSIGGVIADGSYSTFWEGRFVFGDGTARQLTGEGGFISFYDRNVYNRETTLEMTSNGPNQFYLTDTRNNYPGNHQCYIKNSW